MKDPRVGFIERLHDKILARRYMRGPGRRPTAEELERIMRWVEAHPPTRTVTVNRRTAAAPLDPQKLEATLRNHRWLS